MGTGLRGTAELTCLLFLDGGRVWGVTSKEASLWTEPTDLYLEYREEVERMSDLSLRNVGLKRTSGHWTNHKNLLSLSFLIHRVGYITCILKHQD